MTASGFFATHSLFSKIESRGTVWTQHFEVLGQGKDDSHRREEQYHTCFTTEENREHCVNEAWFI